MRVVLVLQPGAGEHVPGGAGRKVYTEIGEDHGDVELGVGVDDQWGIGGDLPQDGNHGRTGVVVGVGARDREVPDVVADADLHITDHVAPPRVEPGGLSVDHHRSVPGGEDLVDHNYSTLRSWPVTLECSRDHLLLK